MVKVALVYGTDLKSVSPGGVQNYLKRLIDAAPAEADITLYGAGQAPDDFAHKFVSVLDPQRIEGKLNWAFSKALFSIDFSEYEQVIFQRADNQMFVRKSGRNNFVLILHGGTLNAWRSQRSFFSALYPLVEVIAILRSRKVFSVSIKDTWGHRLFQKRLHKAPRVFDSVLFNQIDVSDSRQDFAIVGRLSQEKQFHLAVQALSDACLSTNIPARLLVIGSGSEDASLRAIPHSPLLSVEFLGQKDPNEISSILKSKVGHLLITSRFEGFPLVALEAAACRVNVLAIRAPGVTGAMSELGFEAYKNFVSFKDVIRQILLTRDSYAAPGLPQDESKIFWAEYLN